MSQGRETILSFVPHMVWTARPDGTLEYVNPAWVDYSGLTIAECLADNLTSTVHPDDLPVARKAWRDGLARGIAFSFETRLRRRDGAWLWHEVRVAPIPDPRTGLAGWIGTTTDIHQRRTAETDRQRILDSIADGFLALDRDFRLTYVNKAARDILETPESELLGGLFWEAFPGVGEAAPYRMVMQERVAAEFECRYKPWDRWFSVRTYPASDGGITIYFRDVTQAHLRRAREKANTALLDSIFANAPVGLGVFDSELRLVRVNEALAAINGIPVSAHLGRTVLDLLGEAGRRIVPVLREVISNGLVQTLQISSETPARPGETRDWLASYYPLRLEDGKPGVGCVVVDITSQTQAQLAAVETERQFRVLADSIPALCWMAHRDGHVFWYNARWYDYTGTTPEEMAGWGWQRVHDPAALPAVMDQWRTAIERGEPVQMTFPLRAADGTYRTFLTRVNPVRDNDGKVVRWFGANIDINAEQEAQEALRASETRLRRIVDSGVIGIFFWDREGNVLDGNDRYLSLVGYSRDDLQAGRLGWQLMTPPEWSAADHLALEQLNRTGACDPFEKEYIRKDGSRVPILVGGALLDERDFNGVGYVVDISERKRAEEALRRHNEDLQQFAWAASHDLQEPLRMVTAYTQLLDRRYGHTLPLDARRWMDYAVSGAHRIEQLLRDLREYWQVSEQSATPPEEVCPTDALERALANLAESIDQAGAVIELPSLPKVMAHHTAVLLLFQNLLSNAIKYRHPHRAAEIRIVGTRRESLVEFTVSDNGIGIAPDWHERIFGIFKRLHRHDEIPGTGMGLAICRRIVERYGGVIRVESTPGDGSTFRFTLPAA